MDKSNLRASDPLWADPNCVNVIRQMLNARFPELDNAPEREHPLIAIGVVLVTAVILGSTDLRHLSTLTGYSCRFISAVSSNMRRSGLWSAQGYKPDRVRRWFSPAELVRNGTAFWEDVQVAEGSMQTQGVEISEKADPCKVYWDDCGTSLDAAWALLYGIRKDLPFVKEVLLRITPEPIGFEQSPEYQPALVLLSALVCGPDAAKLTNFTGVSESLVSNIRLWMIEAGLWTIREVRCEHWYNQDESFRVVVFWTDVLVAQGLVDRRWDQHEGAYRYYRAGQCLPLQ
jgi:hypothetical protein